MDYAWTMCGLCQGYVWIMRGFSTMLELFDHAWIRHGFFDYSMFEHYSIMLGSCVDLAHFSKRRMLISKHADL